MKEDERPPLPGFLVRQPSPVPATEVHKIIVLDVMLAAEPGHKAAVIDGLLARMVVTTSRLCARSPLTRVCGVLADRSAVGGCGGPNSRIYRETRRTSRRPRLLVVTTSRL